MSGGRGCGRGVREGLWKGLWTDAAWEAAGMPARSAAAGCRPARRGRRRRAQRSRRRDRSSACVRRSGAAHSARRRCRWPRWRGRAGCRPPACTCVQWRWRPRRWMRSRWWRCAPRRAHVTATRRVGRASAAARRRTCMQAQSVRRARRWGSGGTGQLAYSPAASKGPQQVTIKRPASGLRGDQATTRGNPWRGKRPSGDIKRSSSGHPCRGTSTAAISRSRSRGQSRRVR